MFRFCGFLILLVAFLYWVQHDPFFWDTVQLGSKHAHHFFQNHLRWHPLPPEIDSGHPPMFGWYIAAVWTLFGKSLPASHWAVAPFVLANFILLYRLGQRLSINHRFAIWLPILAFSDPVLLGQSALVSPDVVLVTGFLLAVEGLLNRRHWMVALGVLLLCMVSMRGMMVAGGLMAWTLLDWIRDTKDASRRPFAWTCQVLGFIPGLSFAAWFLWWHWQATGWLGYHPGSPWAPAFERVGGSGFVKNCLVVGWRWVDFGRIGEWLLLGGLVFITRAGRMSDTRLPKWMSMRSPHWTILLFFSLLVFLTPSALLYHNLSAHRYLLPAFLALHFVVFHAIVTAHFSEKIKTGFFVSLVIVLATGNCWIYPRGISMDWDSTLAHHPYHRLRAEMLAYIDVQKIDYQSVGSAFPNLNTGENLLLDGDARHFSERDFSQNRYVLASNVFNDFSEADYQWLVQEWVLEKRLESGGVWLELYRRKN